ncbi:hypothetical protein [Nocardia thailandica]
MAESTGVFASLRVPSAGAADSRSPAADGTLIAPDVAVFPAVSREVLDRAADGDVLLASGGTAEPVAIDLISAYGPEGATFLSAVVKLAGTAAGPTEPANAVTGPQLQQALEAAAGDIGAALEQLGLRPAPAPADLAELSGRTGPAADDEPAERRAQRVHYFTEVAAFGGFFGCWFLRAC